jgi:TPR repeat protein
MLEQAGARASRVRRAAVRGEARAMLAYAEMLSPTSDERPGIAKSAHAALRWLRRALARGQHEANALLGYSLFHGIGTESRAEEGLRRMQAAATRGWARAVIFLVESTEMVGPTRAEHDALCRLCSQAERRVRRLEAARREGERRRLRGCASELFTKAMRSARDPGQVPAPGTAAYRLLRYAAALGHAGARRALGNGA